jgi:co-chaperonin GroES (HSP10)
MASLYDAKHIKIKAIKDWVLVTEMDFGEITTGSGIVLRSDNGKSHGVKPRWGQVYAIGPEQKDVDVGQWILIEHGRWTRAMHIDDGTGEKKIHRVDVTGIMLVSDSPPSPEDSMVGDSV